MSDLHIAELMAEAKLAGLSLAVLDWFGVKPEGTAQRSTRRFPAPSARRRLDKPARLAHEGSH
jgi:hypothetical protein